MSPRKNYTLLIVSNVLIAFSALGLFYGQSQKHNETINGYEIALSANQCSKIVPLCRSPEKEKRLEKELAIDVAVKISVYTTNDINAQILTTFNDMTELVVLASNSEWSEVISVRGFPVWVQEDLVRKFASGYVSVIVNRANARSVAGVSNSVSLGKLFIGDVLKVSRRQGQWVRVWSPLKFSAWVKTKDLGPPYDNF
jgi:hypothetical protein